MLSTKDFVEKVTRCDLLNHVPYSIGYLINTVFFSIGLDKTENVLYSKVMNRFAFSSKAKHIEYGLQRSTAQKTDLISFVSNQFRQLSRKNLKIPIQLYQL